MRQVLFHFIGKEIWDSETYEKFIQSHLGG